MPSSNISRELTRDELSRVVRARLNAENFEAVPLPGGMFNNSYLITAGSRKAVLRAGPVNRDLLLPFEQNLMRAEKRFDTLCARIGVPVPKVLACDTERKLIDRDYMLTAYIESVPLSSPEIPESEKPALFEAVGNYARAINGVSGKKFGRLSEVLAGNSSESWSDALLSEVNALTVKSLEHNVLTPEEAKRAKHVFETRRALLDEITVPRLCHADLWAGNVLVSSSGGCYSVAAIIDGDRSVLGDPDFELASGWMIDGAFLKGYNDPGFTDPRRALRRKLYMLLYNLIDAYVCLVEYANEKTSALNKSAALVLIDELE